MGRKFRFLNNRAGPRILSVLVQRVLNLVYSRIFRNRFMIMDGRTVGTGKSRPKKLHVHDGAKSIESILFSGHIYQGNYDLRV